MTRIPQRVGLALLLALPAAAQESSQAHQQYSTKFKADGLVRQEWTRDIFDTADLSHDETRRRFQLRPRIELGVSKLLLGVGGEFNYSSDENTVPPPALIRDNYKSRDVRLDIAFASLRPTNWISARGGRFEMPVGLTEMTWDKDIRPQGGTLALERHDKGGAKVLGLTVLAARGSHVFDDDKTNMLLFSGEVGLGQSVNTRLELVGSYLRFTDIDELEPKIRRQNSRVAGALVQDYDVIDLVARLRHEGKTTSQLVANVCWNRKAVNTSLAAGETAALHNRGLWLAVVLGSTKTARARLEYTYASVDKDATLAAYATDDFFWATGWAGHRGDIGLKASDRSALHIVGQVQRFKDSPRVVERDHWVSRLRLEMRLTY